MHKRQHLHEWARRQVWFNLNDAKPGAGPVSVTMRGTQAAVEPQPEGIKVACGRSVEGAAGLDCSTT